MPHAAHTLGVTEGASVPLPPPIAFLESEGGVTPGIPFRAVIDGRFARRPASPFPVRATFGLDWLVVGVAVAVAVLAVLLLPCNPLGDVLLEKQV